MDRRKDTPVKGERLPPEYMKMIGSIFDKNFVDAIKGRGKNRESFVVYGEIFPDEVLVAVSLKNPVNLRMTTCYASIDFPPVSMIPEGGGPTTPVKDTSVSQAVQVAVGACVDVVASFFQTYFDESRPVDYDTEYHQEWAIVDLDKTTRIYVKLNRDNLEVEAASDSFIAQHEAMSDRDNLGANDDAPAPEEENDTELQAETEDDDDEDAEEEDQNVSADSGEEDIEINKPSGKKKTIIH